MFHPWSIKAMNIMIGLLQDSQCRAANERGMEMQPSITHTVMQTHLRLQETTLGVLWAILVPDLNISTRTG